MRDFESMNLEDGERSVRPTSGRSNVPSEQKHSRGHHEERDPRVVTHMPDLGMGSPSGDPDPRDEYHPFRRPSTRRILPTIRGKYIVGCLLIMFGVLFGLSRFFDNPKAEEAAHKAERAAETTAEHGELLAFAPSSDTSSPSTPSLTDSFPAPPSPTTSNVPWSTPSSLYTGTPDMPPTVAYDAYGNPIPSTTPSETIGSNGFSYPYDVADPQAAPPLPAVDAQYAVTPQPQYPQPVQPQYPPQTQFAAEAPIAVAANPVPWNDSQSSPLSRETAGAWGTPQNPAIQNPAPQVAEQPVAQGWPTVAQPMTAPVQPQPWEQTAATGQPMPGGMPPAGYMTDTSPPLGQQPLYPAQPQPAPVSGGPAYDYAMGGQLPPPSNPGIVPQPSNWQNTPAPGPASMTGGPATDAWNQTMATASAPQAPLQPQVLAQPQAPPQPQVLGQPQPQPLQPQPQQQVWAPPRPSTQQTPVYPPNTPTIPPPPRHIATAIPGMTTREVEFTAGYVEPAYVAPPTRGPAPNPYPAGYQNPPQGYPPTGGAPQPPAPGQPPTYF